jgi:3-oxoacyl-[acyl-carrier-protein] synthase II
MNRQAVITGLGIVSPIGTGVEAFWRAAREGRSGIGRPTLFDASKLPPECQVVGEVRDFDPRNWMSTPHYKKAARFSQFAVAASKLAVNDSQLELAHVPRERLKVAIGTTLNGEVDVAESNLGRFLRGSDPSRWACLEYPAHAATSHVSISVGSQGANTTLGTACAAGLDAIGWATEKLRDGSATTVIAGGTDAPLSPFILAIFRSVGVLSKWSGPPDEASRPFDALRSGLVLAEGAAIVVLEDEECARARGARIYARVLGFASASEGSHLRKVDDTGETAARVMLHALRLARISPQEIDFVCAHGNSMPDYDAAETAALKRAFGRHAWNLPVSSVKSMCGQALAASGAMQVVLSCLVLKHQTVPPTINYRVSDPLCDLDYVPNNARPARVKSLLIHAHGLGGTHSAMVLGVRSD